MHTKIVTFLRMVMLAASLGLLATTIPPIPTANAVKEFDVTGSLDCGVRSGERCEFTDWEAGPTMALFTEDISGERMRLEVDASWLRDHLTAFRQDDYVWFTVWDGIGEHPVIVSVVEHRCQDGRYPHGQVAHGLSTSDFCKLPG